MSRRVRSASMRAYSASRMAASASARFCSTASRLRLNSSSGSSPIVGGAGLDIGELSQDWCGQDRPDHVEDLVDGDLCGDGVHRWAPSLCLCFGLEGWVVQASSAAAIRRAAGAALVFARVEEEN